MAAWVASAYLPTASSDSLAATPLLLPPPQYDPAQVKSPGLELGAQAVLPLERTLGRGESLGAMLADLGLGAADRQLVSTALAAHVELRRLKPGLRAFAVLAADSRPSSLRLEVPGQGRLQLAAVEGEWQSAWQPAVEEVQIRRVEAEISSSLSAALTAANAPADVAYRVADVLRWDVDFTRDLRDGDRLQVLYEQVLLDGAPERVGEIVGVALWNRGTLIEAFRYHDGGYYDGNGRPLQKMFLRSPLAFSNRITSKFSHARFHPILKTFRPHYGVDYGAATGTPVHVTADGIVLSVGWDTGGGKTVKVRHPDGYVTCYLHLSNYAKGLGRGDRVRQNDVIGYVGATGLATAPHLDYRVQHNGKWIDPLSLKTVPAAGLSRDEQQVFAAWRDQARAAMATGVMTQFPEAGLQLAESKLGEPQPLTAIGGR